MPHAIVRVWVPPELPSAIGRHPDVAGTRRNANGDVRRCYDHGRNRDDCPNCNRLCGRPRPTDSQEPHSDRNCEHRFPNHTILQKLVPVGRSNGRDVKDGSLLTARRLRGRLTEQLHKPLVKVWERQRLSNERHRPKLNNGARQLLVVTA